MRKPYAKALCTRVLLKDICKGILNGGGRPEAAAPPFTEGAPPL